MATYPNAQSNGPLDAPILLPVSNSTYTISEDKYMPIATGDMTIRGPAVVNGLEEDGKRSAYTKDDSELCVNLALPLHKSNATRLEQTAFNYMDWALSQVFPEEVLGRQPHFCKMYAFIKTVNPSVFSHVKRRAGVRGKSVGKMQLKSKKSSPILL
jgi:hypothetical protein